MTIFNLQKKALSCIILLCFLTSFALAKNKTSNSGNHASVASQLLFGGFSKKHIVETADSRNGSVLSKRAATGPDTIRIIAFRIEFNNGHPDTTPATTGNGLFGLQLGKDPTEIKYYTDNVYKYDDLHHDSAYVSNQLEYARYYFQTVSRGKLNIMYSIYPSGQYGAYDVLLPMTAYGPGSKKKEETYAQYNERINVRLIKFIKDAINSANNNTNSPFTSLHRDPTSGFILDSSGKRCVFLIVHAGSSFLTDGGLQGAAAANSPSDMIDAFITPGYFDFYKDSLGIKTVGIEVKGSGGSTFLIDETMMVSETSNQDSLNWGIHGILVNQIARQLGIPDLFSTSSGTTAVGAFCIMDFYGYSASPSQGFIPPWPCAWVRAFMKWDIPVVMPIGTQNSMRLKAVSEGKLGDTTIALIPINDHEYYLLENRQRNLSHDPSIFKYDTLDKVKTIDPAFSLNLDNNVVATTGKDSSNCILKVKNFDASLPASGVVVWHVDENIIKNRLKYDYLNADSSYRAISMVEADGINDIGIAFQDIFYQLAFDAGGAEDVFPHLTKKTDTTFTVRHFGPFTKPSTHSNDGGQTYLTIDIQETDGSKTEVNSVSHNENYVVTNYSDTFFTVSASWDFLSPGWPKRMVVDSGEKYFDPVLFRQNGAADLVTLSKKGRLYAWPINSTAPSSLGDTQSVVRYRSIRNDSLKNAPSMISMDSLWPDTIRYFSLPGAFTFPSVINNKLFVPVNNPKSDSSVYIIKLISDLSMAKDVVPLPSVPATYVCKLSGNYWAIGCINGLVYAADSSNYSSDFKTLKMPTNSPVSSIAALANEPGKFVCIQDNDSLSLGSVVLDSVLFSIKVPYGIPPFTLVTGDINNDSANEIVVCDSRKGLWAYTRDTRGFKPALGWEQAPIDWATPGDTSSDRHTRAINTAAPALADINGDGRLEIIIGGSSGLYALNYKGVLINGWPAYLDNRFFRGNVACSPAVVSAPSGSSGPLVIYQSPTGENETFEIDTIIKTNKTSGIIKFITTSGDTDSITGLTATYIDSALVLGDSLILPFTLPGGLVDAVDPSGHRPLYAIGKNQLYSRWPFSTGSLQGASPLLDTIGGDTLNMFAIGNNGWVYRWKLNGDMVGNSLIWKQTGYDGSRPFAYLASVAGTTKTENAPVFFFSYPNPTNGSKFVFFKYKFSGPAQNVRLDIFTYTGLHVFSQSNLSGSYPGENQLSPVSLANYGSGIYRCRFEAEVGGKKYVQYWKMAVVK